jgi:hypothetical protein
MVDLSSHDLLMRLDTDAPAPIWDVAGEQTRPAAGEVPIESLTESTVEVPVSSLLPADSPRFGRPDPEHAMLLAEVGAALPPILVRRPTMRVIDGMHRLGAAELRGDRTIRVRFFEGSEEEAFLLAVRCNVVHGLPLKIAERRAATQRIIKSQPDMSDRSIAVITGLAPKTVAGIRQATSEEVSQPDARLGRDGRWRPLRPAEGRRVAGELFVEHPDASLRRIAREAGISVGTARDVRERVRRGDDPTAPRQRPADGPGSEPVDRRPPERQPTSPVDPDLILRTLRRDPALLYSDAGRSLLRWLGSRVVSQSDWEQILPSIPPHCAIVVARMARGSATAWGDFADALERRAKDCA